MRRLVINADDFGLTDGICRAVTELMNARAICSTTLMLAADGAVDRCRAWNVRRLVGKAGVHLQLTGGSPVLPSNEVPTLVNGDTGRFRPKESLASVDPEDAAREWRAQILLAHEVLGARPSHLDSHHGAHHIPRLADVFIRLAMEFNLPVRDRRTMQQLRPGTRLRGTDVVLYQWTARGLGSADLQNQLRDAIDGSSDADVLELVTHPGYSDDTLRRVSALNDLRDQDRASLLRLAASGWLEAAGLHLISFSEMS